VPYEIVITDDASDDSSWAVLRELAAHDPRLRAQRFARNCGESAASWAGMLASCGRVIVTLDADLQNDPAEIPRFLAALDQADCVCGTRVEARRSGDDWLRVLSSRIANGVRIRLGGGDISDAGCTYRAFRRECLANIRFFKGIHRFLPTLIAMEGFRVCEIPVRNRPRVSGHSHYGVRNRIFVALADLLAIRWMKSRAVRYEIIESTDRAQEERRGSPWLQGARASNRGRSSVIRCQAGFWPTKMWQNARESGARSRTPAGIVTRSVPSRATARGEPQMRQNACRYAGGSLRSGASNSETRSAPRVQRKFDARAAASAANAEPLAFRHRVAWQFWTGVRMPSISKPTPLQRQLPVTSRRAWAVSRAPFRSRRDALSGA